MFNFFFSLDILKKLDQQSELYKFLSELPNTNIIGVSRSILNVRREDNLYWLPRDKFQKFITDHKGKNVYIGFKDYDLYNAVNSKTLFLVPDWINDQVGEKAKKYGIQIHTENQLIQMLQIFININTMFYELEVDEFATVYALTNANSKQSNEIERQAIEKFRATLKEKNSTNLDAIKLILSAVLSQKDEFMNTNIWAIMPSSGIQYNEEMMSIKEGIRYQYKGLYDTIDHPLIIRNKIVAKSHFTPKNERLKKGAAKHLESVYLNPFYKDKLKGKVVTILDDYVTNGISFESIRNLLIKAEVKHINFIAIGRFHSFDNGGKGIYQKEEYTISGNIYNPGYEFNLVTATDIGKNGIYNNEAIKSIEAITELLY